MADTTPAMKDAPMTDLSPATRKTLRPRPPRKGDSLTVDTSTTRATLLREIRSKRNRRLPFLAIVAAVGIAVFVSGEFFFPPAYPDPHPWLRVFFASAGALVFIFGLAFAIDNIDQALKRAAEVKAMTPSELLLNAAQRWMGGDWTARYNDDADDTRIELCNPYLGIDDVFAFMSIQTSPDSPREATLTVIASETDAPDD